MRKKMEWQWEKLDDNTFRAKVIGGWLIKCIEGKALAVTFLPDKDHEYMVIDPLKPEVRAKSEIPKELQ